MKCVRCSVRLRGAISAPSRCAACLAEIRAVVETIAAQQTLLALMYLVTHPKERSLV